jgi:CARDB
MRRLLPTISIAAVLAGAGLATGTAAGPHPGARDARARLIACHAAPARADRYLVVEGTMRSLQSNDTMQLRFDLFRKRGSSSFARVDGPGLGVWNKASAGVARYKFRTKIENLPAPGRYRVTVRYRWLSSGKRFASTARLTPVCVQPDQRPDLRIAGVTATKGTSKQTATYHVTVRNTGRNAAGPFGVALTVDGTTQPTDPVAGLAAGARRIVDIVAPRCASGGSLAVSVDPDNTVDESDETNNQRSIACPV